MTQEEIIEYAKEAVGIITGKRPSLVSLARYIGVNRSTVHRWLTEESTPSYKNYDRKLEVLVDFYLNHQQSIQQTEQKIKRLSNG